MQHHESLERSAPSSQAGSQAEAVAALRSPGTIGVGVGVIVLRHGKVLLGKRKGSHGAGTWSAPGGRLEFGESIQACAARELREETALDLGAVEPGPYTNDVFADVQEQYVTAFVVARQATGDPANLEPHKCEGWAWFDWNDLPQPLFAPLQSLVASGYIAL
ncbi:nucleotide triphosphate diphosphatase NUDT15 [Variovorax sp. LT1R20]|uniref:nucleotide triphosphate diphosphatase NUDT15 n=1 Tax=Variovorax sp. LT1R20 TaxID=3443729 RepID=UPI003F45C400